MYVCHTEFVDLLKVVCDRYFVSIIRKLMIDHTLVKVDIVHDIGTLIAPVSNDTLTDELHLDHLLVLMITVRPFLKLSNFLKA